MGQTVVTFKHLSLLLEGILIMVTIVIAIYDTTQGRQQRKGREREAQTNMRSTLNANQFIDEHVHVQLYMSINIDF